MKAFKTTIALLLCLVAIPAFAGNGDDKKEIRKEKKRFTKEVRLMKEAKNHKPTSKNEVAFNVAKGKF